MITGFQMFKAPAGNWVVIIQEHDRPLGWWDYDYKTEEEAARALTGKIRGALVRQEWQERTAQEVN